MSGHARLAAPVLVTRAQPQATRWAASLAARGVHALALPLIELAPAADLGALVLAQGAMANYRAVMFVSAAAVSGFFEANGPLEHMEYAHSATKLRAWVTGPGTKAALVQRAVQVQMIDCPPADALTYDSESLWAVVHRQVVPGDRVLVVRGVDATWSAAQRRTLWGVDAAAARGYEGDEGAGAGAGAVPSHGSGRDWLTQQIQRAGGEVDFVLAYQRGVPVWDENQTELARDGARGDAVWLFNSSQAIANLALTLPDVSWKFARAVATHPRIAQAALSLGFGVVRTSRPALLDVVASIESAG